MQNETITSETPSLTKNTSTAKYYQTPLLIRVLCFLFFPLVSLFESIRFEKETLGKNIKAFIGILILISSYIVNIILQILYTEYLTYFFMVNLLIGLACMYFYSGRTEVYGGEGEGFTRKQLCSIGIFLSVVNVLPNIDLFGIRDIVIVPKMGTLELWQYCVISVVFVSLSLYLYQICKPVGVNIKMFFILYCLSSVFVVQAIGYWETTLKLLNSSGSWIDYIVVYMVGAILAFDYHNCQSTMGIIKVWFQKTLAKMFNLLVILLMYEGAFPPISQLIHKEMYEQNLITENTLSRFSLLDFDDVSHAKNYKMKLNLINKSLLFDENPKQSTYVQWLLEQPKSLKSKSSILFDLKQYLKESSKFPSFKIDKTLFFRPVDSEWDVLIAVAKKQGLINDHNEIISKYKTNTSEKNYGSLPSMNLLHTVSFVKEVLGLESTSIEPKLEYVKTLLKSNLYPIVQFDMSQVTYYGAIVELDYKNGFALLRMESGVAKEGLAKLYDAGLDEKHFERVVAEQVLIVPISDLEKTLRQCDLPMIVLSSADHVSKLLKISKEELRYLKRASYFQEIHSIDSARYEKLIVKSNNGFTKSMIMGQWLHDYLHEYTLSNDDISMLANHEPRDEQLKKILKYLELSPLANRSKVRLGGCLFDEYPKLDTSLKPLLKHLFVEEDDIGDYAMSDKLYNFATGLYLHGDYKRALPYFKIINARYPKHFNYEVAYKLCLLQLDSPPGDFKSSIAKKSGKWLYFRFLKLYKKDNKKQAENLLNRVLKEDPHNKMAIQLLQKYYKKEELQFEFSSFEGL